MTYRALISRIGYRLFDAALCFEYLLVKLVRDAARIVGRSADSSMKHAKRQLDALEGAVR